MQNLTIYCLTVQLFTTTMESSLFSPTDSPVFFTKGKTLTFDCEDDSSCDSGYGSPTVKVSTFSLDTPEARALTPEKPGSRFDLCSVKRSLAFKRLRGEDVEVTCPRKRLCSWDEQQEDVEVDLGIVLPEMSEKSDVIKSAVDKMESDETLVGDGSKTHTLPTTEGRHKDLQSVSPKTVQKLIGREFDDVISGYTIIDCRYPYEYEGGHIEGALNLYTEALVDKFISSRQTSYSGARNILIFHCEFSSERGPKLLRHLRSLDRQLNSHRYPELFYPKVYLLVGGYKAFFEQHQEFCQPQTYRPMLHSDYAAELRHFRSSKAQAGRQKKKATRRRQLTDSPFSFAL